MRVTKLNVKNLSIKELNVILGELKQEKKYLFSINQTNLYSGKINTKENHIDIVETELKNR